MGGRITGYLTAIYRELQTIRADLSSLDKRVLKIDRKISQSANARLGSLEENLTSALFSLPDHLRRTMVAAKDLLEEFTATDVSNITGRKRAVESKYLNDLVVLGWMNKQRAGRHVYFSLRATEVKA